AGLRLLTLDPLQEPMHRALMQLYVDAGRRPAALRQYQLCVDVLRRELDVEPESATKALYQTILRAAPPPTATRTSTRAPRHDAVTTAGPRLEAFRPGGVSRDAEALPRLASTSRTALARLFPELGQTISSGASPIDARILFEAVDQLIATLAAERPLAIALEDLHWADEL